MNRYENNKVLSLVEDGVYLSIALAGVVGLGWIFLNVIY